MVHVTRAAGNARAVALRVLERIEHEGAFANLVLGPTLERSSLSTVDRRFVTDLVYGTTRMRRSCDVFIDRFVARDPGARLRTVLRLGTYQLRYAGVAPHAAVAETVALAPASARGFVNAVLRRIAAADPLWPNAAAELSYPDWMVDLLAEELGVTEAEAALRAMNEPATVTTRSDGYIQDLSSQWVAAAVEARPGERVLDLCAAPGGKATALAATGAQVVAADLRAGRAGLIVTNAQATGHPVAVVVGDAARPGFRLRHMDAVLLDAACSGLGALRRRADARWRINPEDISELADLQARMLRAAADLVAPGGRLIYSVCTLTARESIDHPIPCGFVVDPRPPEGHWRRFAHGWRVLPQDAGTDGMVVIRYRRDDD